jgi:feruloyl esterase
MVLRRSGTIEYYESVLDEQRSRRRTEDFVRLFLVPGMDHCGAIGGGLEDWDRLAPLVRWVQQGAAPDRIVASQTLSDKTIRTRPLCPYPREARWVGGGNTDDAANFRCEMPRRGDPRGWTHKPSDDDVDIDE